MNQLSARVHPAASVHPGAVLADGVEIGPFVTIEAGVRVGAGTRVLAGTVLMSGTIVGAGCLLGPYAIVGGQPMDTNFGGEESGVHVGNRVQIRDFATIHRATGSGMVTVLEDDSMVMTYVHVSHNSRVGRHAVLTSGVQLGGHTVIGERAVLGAGVVTHQFVRIGCVAMLAATSAVGQDILPYSLAHGNRARHLGTNRVGIRRAGIDGERHRAIEATLRAARLRDAGRLRELAETSADSQYIQDFIASSARGVARFAGNGS